ncbi:MAG: GNAT family N-acetyltransferase [Actinobacteria bacterium]|nr:GNAT family N-acetyltransferase [Actinomycetota bacterium]
MTPPDDGPVDDDRLRVVPANEASWDDLEAIFGTTDAGHCRCQRFKVRGWMWRDTTLPERRDAQRDQTGCDDPDAPSTSGLVAYLDGEPVGWVAVEPRTAYPNLLGRRTVWAGRQEDKDDDGVWAATCFVVRKGYRGRGLTYPLARAALAHARACGARAVEGYGILTPPGKEITWGEVHVGAVQVFEEAGFAPVSRPSVRRVVLRAEPDGPCGAPPQD